MAPSPTAGSNRSAEPLPGARSPRASGNLSRSFPSRDSQPNYVQTFGQVTRTMSLHAALGVTQPVDTPYRDSPWVVMKFGGRSVSTAENWERIAGVIRERLAEGVR